MRCSKTDVVLYFDGWLIVAMQDPSGMTKSKPTLVLQSFFGDEVDEIRQEG